MVNKPSVPEIITVNSEALQTQIRDLLPSQAGFGSELQATNVITPIIDLTSAAEGSGLPVDLARAIAFGSQTAISVANTTTTLANAPGFYRLTAVSNLGSAASGTRATTLTMSDGASTKTVWSHDNQANNVASVLAIDYIFWLAAGESLSCTSSATQARLNGSIRQVADSSGSLVNPSGYPL